METNVSMLEWSPIEVYQYTSVCFYTASEANWGTKDCEEWSLEECCQSEG